MPEPVVTRIVPIDVDPRPRVEVAVPIPIARAAPPAAVAAVDVDVLGICRDRRAERGEGRCERDGEFPHDVLLCDVCDVLLSRRCPLQGLTCRPAGCFMAGATE